MTDQQNTAIQPVCTLLGMTRSNYYKQRTQRRRREVDESFLLDLIHRERSVQPKLGLRKLLYLIRPDLADAGHAGGINGHYFIITGF